MLTPLTEETKRQAEAAASELKERLLPRVLGHLESAWSCGCGAVHADQAEAVDISYPSAYGEHGDMIGLFMHWTVKMKEVGKNPTHGYSYSIGLTTLIPWIELYPIFRDVFGPIAVPLEHPHADGFHDRPDEFWGDRAAKDGRNFAGSGRTVIVREGSPVYIQPTGDLTNSTWLNVELRVDTRLEQYATDGPLLACNVDPCAAHLGGFRGGREGGHRYGGGAEAVEQMLTFYIRLNAEGSKDVFLPIARMTGYDERTGAHTFELDSSVQVLAVAPQ